MPPKPQRIGIAVVRQEGCYLVGTRRTGTVLSGYAEFPGGKCHPGESDQACALRECLEETGVACRPRELLAKTVFDYDYGAVELHFWLCEPVRPQSVSDEHRGFCWIPFGDLSELDFPEGNAAVLAEISRRESEAAQ